MLRKQQVNRPQRGEGWIVDLGYAAKTRPALVLSVPIIDQDRVLAAVVPHTTSIQNTRFEISIPRPFLKPGVFDAQGLQSVPCGKLVRRIGQLSPAEIHSIEQAVKSWLGLIGP